MRTHREAAEQKDTRRSLGFSAHHLCTVRPDAPAPPCTQDQHMTWPLVEEQTALWLPLLAGGGRGGHAGQSLDTEHR